MRSFRLLAPALFALALCGAPSAASAQGFSDIQRGDIEVIVREYLLKHPEVLEEAMAELEQAPDRRRGREACRWSQQE